MPKLLIIFLSTLIVSGNVYANSFHNPFKNPCADKECNECQKTGYEFYTGTIQKKYEVDLKNDISTLNNLLLARRALIKEAAEKSQQEIDRVIYKKLKKLLSHQYRLIGYEEFIPPSLSELSAMKIEFATHPLMISGENQAKLNKQYEQNKI